MAMRVIAGIAKGRHLKLLPGAATRPIMDRVNEGLFNILGQNIRGARFLALSAGPGSARLEALRGAKGVRLVEGGMVKHWDGVWSILAMRCKKAAGKWVLDD